MQLQNMEKQKVSERLNEETYTIINAKEPKSDHVMACMGIISTVLDD